ncbi:MAG: hypothetical protein M1835_007148 [Candelina submexicana]|nr:MAG: hypothetical protein M1835_007148 [Candelina submexicana]
MEHDFAFSYGKPFVGPFSPPLCDFTRIVLNFTVTSRGRQFDRLGIMFLGDTEVFRTSTAEPTPQGIRWTYLKDVSELLALFKRPQKVIFELGNLIDDIYTASFNTTLTATFMYDPNVPVAADVILPISARRSSTDTGSSFSIPEANATNVILLPQNVRSATVTISACGQADEEFWFGHVLSSDQDTFLFSTGSLFGYSPFREVQVLIDGGLAGVVWPFPIIFTGGVAPGLWRPIVGIDAFDLRENEIDITPWLPLLCDGRRHTFEIRVVGINDDGRGHGSLSQSVGHSWIVTGKIFVWLDEPGSTTSGFMSTLLRSDSEASGQMSSPQIQSVLQDPIRESKRQTIVSKPLYHDPQPLLSIFSHVGQNNNGVNETLTFGVHANRELVISSIIYTSSGSRIATWSQSLEYENRGRFSDRGNVQAIMQRTDGRETWACGKSRKYSYPLIVNTSYNAEATSGNFTIDATISRGLEMSTYGDHHQLRDPRLTSMHSIEVANPLKLCGTALSTTQNGTAHYLAVPAISKSFSFGSTEQKFTIHGLEAKPQGDPGSNEELNEIYYRHVLASNGTVVKDQERLSRSIVTHLNLHNMRAVGEQVFEISTIRAILGRGPEAQQSSLEDD